MATIDRRRVLGAVAAGAAAGLGRDGKAQAVRVTRIPSAAAATRSPV